MIKNIFLSLLAGSLLLAFQLTFAHSFHYELQVTSTLKLDDKKQLEAIDVSWLYDGDVSEIMLQDQKDLKKLGNKTIKDLSLLGYFMQAKVNGKVLAFDDVKNTKMEKEHIGEFDMLRLYFTLPLKTAMKLEGKTEIKFYHEDPSSAAIIYYDNAESIKLGDLKKSCKASVKEKGKFEEGEFPQIVTVNCNI